MSESDVECRELSVIFARMELLSGLRDLANEGLHASAWRLPENDEWASDVINDLASYYKFSNAKKIGEVFHNDEEASALDKVATAIRGILADVHLTKPALAMLDHPRWIELARAAKAALELLERNDEICKTPYPDLSGQRGT